MSTGSIFAEEARVTSHLALPAQQFILRLEAPKCAQNVKPGNFVHLSCSQNSFSLKRPFSVLRSGYQEGWIEILYKVVGQGTHDLSTARVDDKLHCLGPIGNSFELNHHTTRPLLLGGGVGIPPILFFAEQLKKKNNISPMVIMGSEIPFPFKVQPSTLLVEGIPNEVTAAMALLEDLSIPSRLTSKQGYSGCFLGYIHELAAIWLNQLSELNRAKVQIFACGPTAMLEAVAGLSQVYKVPCQLSLEEYMACAVGGCAGCTVPITKDGIVSMRRVCVDGPVFEANQVYPERPGQYA